jgi:hypothetical protein
MECRKNYGPPKQFSGMAHESSRSDLGIGVGVLLSVVAVLGAVGMVAVDPSATTASGLHVTAVPFAIAMSAGVAAVVGIHLFWSE